MICAGLSTVLRRMTGGFREPVIWLLLAIVARRIGGIGAASWHVTALGPALVTFGPAAARGGLPTLVKR